MKRNKSGVLPPVELPAGTIELTADLVPAIRSMLRAGLSEEFLKACVRIGDFQPFGGGRKADLVGGLRIDVHAVLKLGSSELDQHKALMTHVNSLRPRTFPSVLGIEPLEDGRVFVVMEQLRGYVTLLDKIYSERTSTSEFTYILNKVFGSLRLMHSIHPGLAPALADLPETREPFVGRLASKLGEIFAADSELAVVMDRPGELMGRRCPPVRELLSRAAELANAVARSVSPVLVHGDAHLGNIMVRRNGAKAYLVRFIDPNPTVGFSQPLYDIGKLLHWAEPVGWAQTRPEVCRADWRPPRGRTGWSLDARTSGTSQAAEKRRAWVEAAVRRFADDVRAGYGAAFEPTLSLATASAHVGLSAILTGDTNRAARRFTFAHALKHLAKLATSD